MKRTLKKAMSTLLAALMILWTAVLAVSDANFVLKASADELQEMTGTCGTNLTWTFMGPEYSNDGVGCTLVISGTGDMEDKPAFPRTETVIINNGVTSIGKSAFSGFYNLHSVTIPDSVISIGERAFEGCYTLTNITVPDSVKSIGEYAFYNCSNLETIAIPNGVINLGPYMFSGCKNLKSISIPDSVTSIGEHAFMDCNSLESITVPESVTSIGYRAFENCHSLKNITIPEGIKKIPSSAFKNCKKLANIILPDSITHISDHAFSGCESLTSIEIPDGISGISPFMFQNCKSLASITIPGSVTYIEWNVFEGCESLKDVYFNGTEDEWDAIQISTDNEPLLNATIHFAETPDVPHTHTYISSVTTPATCTTDGITTYICSCGDSYTETIPAGHKAGNWETILEPTTESEGKKTKKCTVCGETLEEEVIAKLPTEDNKIVKIPSTVLINYGDSIILHVDPLLVPIGGHVEWTASNDNFEIVEISADGTTCKITPVSSGNTEFTATIYDAEGNAIASDTQEMESKAGFFQRIIAFFKKLFGLTKTYTEAII